MPIRRAAHLSAAAFLVVIAMVAAAADVGVKIATDDKAGPHLTDAKGMALYVFKKDTPGKSACLGECAVKWPPFYLGEGAPAGGLNASDFKTITRDDGKKQTTYRDMPLYYFQGDKGPGQTTGEGFRGVWSLAKP